MLIDCSCLGFLKKLDNKYHHNLEEGFAHVTLLQCRVLNKLLKRIEGESFSVNRNKIFVTFGKHVISPFAYINIMCFSPCHGCNVCGAFSFFFHINRLVALCKMSLRSITDLSSSLIYI